MTTPKVSLFLTTYNWSEALSLCLQSIAQQTHLPDEVIVADDGSGEETKKVVEALASSFPCPLKHVWQEDKGYRINAIRNKAIAQVSHPYIIQIDGDILCDKNFVKDHLRFAKNNRLVIGRRIDISEENTRKYCKALKAGVLNSFRSKPAAILHQSLLYDSTSVRGVRGCNMAYWKADAYQVNGYDEEMTSKGPNDKEFSARLINNGVQAYNLKFYANVFHLFHGEEGLRSNYKMVKELYDEAINTDKKTCHKGLQQ